MSARCQVTGAEPGFGHRLSHSNRHTRRRWNPNLHHHTFYVPSLRRTVKLRVSTKGLRIIDRRGIDAVVAQILARGEKV